MQVSRFSCPHCSTQLRIRDRMYVGKVVSCPDCSQEFEIISDGPKRLAARKIDTTSTDGSQKDSRRKRRIGKRTKNRISPPKPQTSDADESSTNAASKPSLPNRLIGFLKNPVTVCWFTALIAAGSIVGLIVSKSADRDSKESTETTSNENTAGPDTKTQPPANSDPWHAADDPKSHLRQIGRLIGDFRKTHGRFPRGTFPSPELQPNQRMSWLAILVAESKRFGARQPQWQRSWNDAANETFARQRIPLYLNPRRNPNPGRDGMPVTHYVGVAGVGADGPLLPVDHPRAGIFAYHRTTRRKDIRDGPANTMMVAGVQNHLGGWVVGGQATIRPFTKTPYVNGPDGFGTGHGERMMVLMADGSVREVSRKTSPVVVRRMAAMADGFSLDPKLPGDPLELPSPKKKEPAVIAKKKPKPPPRIRPAVVAMKPVHVRNGVPLVDVGAALSQPILRFEHTKGVALMTVLREIEEIAGVPIHIDKSIDRGENSPLKQPVRVKLKNVTLGKILKAVLTPAGLSFTTGLRGIRIITAPASKRPLDSGGP